MTLPEDTRPHNVRPYTLVPVYEKIPVNDPNNWMATRDGRILSYDICFVARDGYRVVENCESKKEAEKVADIYNAYELLNDQDPTSATHKYHYWGNDITTYLKKDAKGAWLQYSLFPACRWQRADQLGADLVPVEGGEPFEERIAEKLAWARLVRNADGTTQEATC